MRVFQSALAGAIGIASIAQAEMKFTLDFGPEILALETSDPLLYHNYTSGFAAATAMWSERFIDDITINLYLDLSSDGGSLAFTSVNQGTVATEMVRLQLVNRQTTPYDAIAVQNLPIQGQRFIYTTNDLSSPNPGTRGPAHVEISALSQFMLVPFANQKALGIRDAHDSANDASLRVSSLVEWDFDRSDGIDMDKYDFIGIMAHEIGHAMGFVSGVDNVDQFGTADPTKSWVSVLDLFRQSEASMALIDSPGIIVPVADFAWGGPVIHNIERDVYFSLDGGTTRVAKFAKGALHSGQQASHFYYAGFGDERNMMSPSVSRGLLVDFHEADIIAFDVMGYTPVPEPHTLAFLVIGLLGFQVISRRRAAGHQGTQSADSASCCG